MTYIEFLKTKAAVATASGFEIDKDEINPTLLPHQRDAVWWAIKGGRRAVFAKFGLGKSVIQLEFCRIPKGVQAFLTEAKDDAGKPLWRVQVGAFGVKQNAEAYLAEVKKKGLEAFLVVAGA